MKRHVAFQIKQYEKEPWCELEIEYSTLCILKKHRAILLQVQVATADTTDTIDNDYISSVKKYNIQIIYKAGCP